jgi:hypothetical protein
MAHRDHVLRRSVEIEDEVGLGIVLPLTFEGEVVGGSATEEDCQFVGGGEVREGSEETHVIGSEDREEVGDVEQKENEELLLRMNRVLEEEARSEISSMLESVFEDAVIGTAEAINMRARRVPEECRPMIREWIGEVQRIRDEDRELVCYYGYTARNRRRARGERGRLGNEGEVEVNAEDRDGSVVDTSEDGGSRGDGSGEVSVVPKEGKEGKQGMGYAKEMNYREEKDEVQPPASREAVAESRNERVPYGIQIVEGGAGGIYAWQDIEDEDEKLKEK